MQKRQLAWWIVVLIVGMSGVVGLVAASTAAPRESFAPNLWASPLEIDFGPIGVETYTTKSVVFTNNGNSFLSGFNGGALDAPFFRTLTCDVGLIPGSTCQYDYTFFPDSAGEFTGTSIVETDAGTVEIVLHGTAVSPRLHLSPLALDFGYLTNNGSAPAQTVTIRNSGLGKLKISDITESAPPFLFTPNCPAPPGPGASCPLNIEFKPTTTGDYSATINFITNGGNASVAVMGRSGPDPYSSGQQVSPRIIDFGPVPLGTATPEVIVTVRNLSITDHLLDFEGGDVDAPFAMTTNCVDDIDPATSCEFRYKFSPTAPGEFNATANVTNNAGSFSIELRGEGVGPQITADKLVLDFGPVTPGETSPSQVVTIKNTGPVTLPTLFGGAPDPGGFGAVTSCGQPMAPEATCQFTYTFQPAEFGRYESVSAISLDPQNNQTITVRLSGGIDLPRLSLDFQPDVIKPGELSTLRIQIANPNPAQAITNLSLVGDLPAGVVMADPPNPSVGLGCGGASFQPVAGGSSLAFSNGEILGGQTCVLEVDATAAELGNYTLNATAISDSGDSEPAEATLSVKDPSEIDIPLYLPYVSR